MPADAWSVQIVRGHPSEEEVAAVVAVLLARARSNGDGGTSRPVSRWASSARPRADVLPRGGGAWRASALPR
ncbi:MAG TPA: acyl-CoA carboxylase epsilon subunit [Micromonosporaceae bacterium]|nr:acyl-CoA carboxylase epsilon subunit [Micromonosporaceae bacterium]